MLGGSHSPDSVELKQGGGELSILKAESWKEDEKRTDLKYGKFTKEEDEILREAVAQYIQVSRFYQAPGHGSNHHVPSCR